MGAMHCVFAGLREGANSCACGDVIVWHQTDHALMCLISQGDPFEVFNTFFGGSHPFGGGVGGGNVHFSMGGADQHLICPVACLGVVIHLHSLD